MKKTILIFMAFASFPTIYAQAVEEKIAAKTCECLSKSSGITETVFRDCLTSTMSETILTDKDQKVRESINTVDGIKSMIQKVSDAVIKKFNGGAFQSTNVIGGSDNHTPTLGGKSITSFRKK